MSYHLAKFGNCRHCGNEDIMVLVSNKILLAHMIKVTSDFMGRSPSRWLTILPCLVATGTLVHDIIIAACHMIFQDHMIKVSCDIMGRSTSHYDPIKFGGHRHSGSGDTIILVCYVILKDYMIKGSCEFMGGSPSW